MEREQIWNLLEIIEQQVSSSILGGREDDYEELERLGYIHIDRSSIQHAASLTPAGEAYLSELRHAGT
ncbi:hypothetical protein C7T94_18905 [Pedobacter yulinensis]|uniref:Uncharacterized protein n=1 Tax=Pedobacter yulinensis TaxID=2126353 RepID=A0A2T3HGV8_9SPHI|nr:hypothetical protein [Pedobacter yulinensis]PST81684.1 hypothetical protein C7T94_18905 [Pedobacter yulinensis]